MCIGFLKSFFCFVSLDSQDKLIDIEEKKAKLEIYCNKLSGKRDTPIGSLSNDTIEDGGGSGGYVGDGGCGVSEQLIVENIENNEDERPIPLGSDTNDSTNTTTNSSDSQSSSEHHNQLVNELNGNSYQKIENVLEEKRFFKKIFFSFLRNEIEINN